MNLRYIIAPRTKGANPSLIWEAIFKVDQAALKSALCAMDYNTQFLHTAYWFAVSQKRKADYGMRCAVCNSGNKIAAHHRWYGHHGEEHHHMEDLCVLCDMCHGVFHGHIESNFTPPAQPVVIYEKAVRQKKERVARVRTFTESDIVMPDGDPIILTYELVNRCRTAANAFTNATLRAFGLNKSLMSKGWPARLVGKSMSRGEYRKALEGKYIYNSGRLDAA